MKIALITPYYREEARGNAVTVGRIRRHLDQCGCTTAVFSLDQLAPADIHRALCTFSPDLIHAFHLLRCGPMAREAARSLQIPYILTMTGTDIYRDGVPVCGQEECDLLHAAAAVTVFAEPIRQRLLRSAALPDERVVVVPQGVALPGSSACGEKGAELIFLLPAGLRAVKNILFPLPLLREIHLKFPRVRFLVAGPVLEEEYGTGVIAALSATSYASWMGVVAPAAMPGLYAQASVVLNCSLSEGGMANSLLEAMAWGVPVLAADIEGNRSLVTDGVTGLLYADGADFLSKAERLVVDGNLRERLAHNARIYVEEHCSQLQESERYVQLYRNVS